MRTRAYRPNLSGGLESRLLLSAVAGRPPAPIVFRYRDFRKVAERIQANFRRFGMDGAVEQGDLLLDEISNVAVMIPYGRVDGLGASIRGIVDGMHRDLHAHVPGSVAAARDGVLAAIRAQVEARVRAGDVVLR